MARAPKGTRVTPADVGLASKDYLPLTETQVEGMLASPWFSSGSGARQPVKGGGPLHKALTAQDAPAIFAAIEQAVDPTTPETERWAVLNGPNRGGCTPLMVAVMQSHSVRVIKAIIDAAGVACVPHYSANRLTAADYADMNRGGLHPSVEPALREIEEAVVKATACMRCGACLNVVKPADSFETWLRDSHRRGESNRLCDAMLCDSVPAKKFALCYAPAAPAETPDSEGAIWPLEPALAELPPPTESGADAARRVAACPWLSRDSALRACRRLRSRCYHLVHETSKLRKEVGTALPFNHSTHPPNPPSDNANNVHPNQFSESLAAIEGWAMHGGGNDDNTKQWRVVDLCSGRGLTAALLGVLRPHDVQVLAVDLLHRRFVPAHHAYGNVVYQGETDITADTFARSLADFVAGGRGAILGMHLCGELSVRAIELFVQSRDVESLTLCPCCLPSKARYTDPEAPKAKRQVFARASMDERYSAWGDYLVFCLHESWRRAGGGGDLVITRRLEPAVTSARNLLIVARKPVGGGAVVPT